MEKELNIAAILKDKPVGTKLYSPCCGVCTKGNYGNSERPITLYLPNRVLYHLLGNGKEFETGEIMVYPSKAMQDWSKFAWKKGDVLKVEIGSSGCSCIFDRFTNDDYTEFTGVFDKHLDRFDYFSTSDWCKVTDEKEYESIIQRIETQYGGKLNLDTLKIEKQEFKDGDVVAIVSLKKYVCIAIYQMRQEQYIGFHAVLCNNGKLLLEEPFREDDGDIEIRLATDSEKEQLFDALAKEGKRWNAKTKTLENLPKKYKFKTMDYFLARYNYSKDALWNLYQYAFTDKDGYIFVVNESCIEADKYTCIPYNDQTANLLGTTDDWKGGEE